jgi:uncharacterized protein (TIGR02118 family)
MNYCLFLLAQAENVHADLVVESLGQALVRSLRGMEALTQLSVHRAGGRAQDPAIAHGAGPDWVFQFYFDDLLALEAALARGASLDCALRASDVPAWRGLRWSQQVMAVRRYALATTWPRQDKAIRQACTYFVSYEGQAADDAAWLAHYLRHHPPLMKKLPGLRALEVYSRVDYDSGLDITKSRALQRNLVMFDSLQELNEALNSPVRRELRADYDNFPAFEGTSPHGVMESEIHAPALQA